MGGNKTEEAALSDAIVSDFDVSSLKGAKRVVCIPQRMLFSGWIGTQARLSFRATGAISLLPRRGVERSTTLLMPLLGVGVPVGVDAAGVWGWIVDARPALNSLLAATMPDPVDDVFTRLVGWLDDGEFGQPTKIETRDAGTVWIYPFRPGDRPRIVALF